MFIIILVIDVIIPRGPCAYDVTAHVPRSTLTDPNWLLWQLVSSLS